MSTTGSSSERPGGTRHRPRQTAFVALLVLAVSLALLRKHRPPGMVRTVDEGADPSRGGVVSGCRSAVAILPREHATLAHHLRRVADGFTDLPLDVAVELADDLPVSQDFGLALAGAVGAVLHNVREHAAAGAVVLHADHHRPSGRWEVTVRDDGVGFDADLQSEGIGLALQTRAVLSALGAELTIRSEAGAGTTIAMAGPTIHVQARRRTGRSAGDQPQGGSYGISDR